jgi:hypothetical protein
MLLIYSAPGAGPDYGTPEGQAEMQQWFTYTQQLVDKGAFVAGDPLQGTETATTVRERNGKVLNTDGPFAETKEQLGGYYIIDVQDLDDALAWASRVPNVGYGSIEVRPVADMSMP